MQTVKSREPETAQVPEPPEDKPVVKPAATARYQPGKAAILSLIPGLGHFYVGQPVVGSLVLVSSFLGLTFLTTIIAGKNLFPIVAPLALTFGVHLDKAVCTPQVVAGPIAVALYVLCFLYVSAYFTCDAYRQALKKSLAPVGFKPDMGVTFSGSTGFSYMMHCVLLVVCAVACLFIIKVPEKHTTVIEFEFPEPPPPPPPPPPPKPRPPKEAPKVKPDPVKQVVPPPKPMPIAVKADDNKPADIPLVEEVKQPEAVASTGGAQGASSGDAGTAGAGKDTGEVDLSDYVAQMEKKIRKSWFPPKGEETKKIILKFKIGSQGAVSSVRLKASSGIMIADEAAMTAVKTASPFAPLPKGAPDPVEILFTFDYSVFGGKTLK
jgi:protein TonB